MKKIIFCVPTLGKGGAERVITNLANHFTDKGLFEVFILCKPEGEYLALLNEKIKIYNISKNIRFIPHFISSTYLIFKYCQLIKPDILLSTLPTSNIKCAIVKKITKCKFKFIAREANIVFKSSLNRLFKSPKQFAINATYKMSYLCADSIIANSKDTKDSIINCYNIHEKKIRILPNPVFSSDIYKMAKEKTNDDILNSTFILAVGRLVDQKGFDTLIKSFALVLEKGIKVDLVILGDGPLLNDLKNLSIELKIEDKVHFKGFVQNLYPYYKNCSIFVLTSRFEGFGNVIIEALAFGKPIVSTKCAGGPLYILQNGENALLASIDNTKEISEALVSILTGVTKFDPKKQEERAFYFSIDTVANNYHNFINEVQYK